MTNLEKAQQAHDNKEPNQGLNSDELAELEVDGLMNGATYKGWDLYMWFIETTEKMSTADVVKLISENDHIKEMMTKVIEDDINS